jgi:hypothetical protein
MKRKRDGAAVVGTAAAACAACCAGPIVAFVAALGLGTVAGVLLFGALGLVLAAVGVLIVVVRRRQRRSCAPAPLAVDLELPTRRVKV